MDHDEYWTKVKAEAEERINALFDGKRLTVRSIVGDGNGIDSEADAVKVLAHVLKHGDHEDVASAILSLGDWRQACHELAEHGRAGA